MSEISRENKSTKRGQARAVTRSPAAPPGLFRVLLFDIDGTLIRTVRRPEYRVLIREMLMDIFGTCGRITEVEFGGKTDLAIYREALECEGVSPDLIRERLPGLEARMVEILNDLARKGELFRLCPGVLDLLESLSDRPHLFPSLLTGNVEKLAEAKLRVAGIWHYFRGRGAFGGDAEDRNHLPAFAADRLSEHLGRALSPEQFVIVGDTPRDILCARHFGARALAVASGQHTVEQLEEHSPDALLQDLSDTQRVLEILTAI